MLGGPQSRAVGKFNVFRHLNCVPAVLSQVVGFKQISAWAAANDRLPPFQGKNVRWERAKPGYWCPNNCLNMTGMQQLRSGDWPGAHEASTIAEPQRHDIIELGLGDWLGRQDSNLQPTVPKTGALPIELLPSSDRLIRRVRRPVQDRFCGFFISSAGTIPVVGFFGAGGRPLSIPRARRSRSSRARRLRWPERRPPADLLSG